MEQTNSTSSILIENFEDFLSNNASNDSSANNNYIIDYGKMTVDELKTLLELPNLFVLVSTNAEDEIQILTPPPLIEKPETPNRKPVIIKFAKRPLYANQTPQPTDATLKHPRKTNRKRSCPDHDRPDEPFNKLTSLPYPKHEKYLYEI